MLKKIVIFDSGFGGELFADYVEAKMPIFEVIRVIDWRHSADIIKSPRLARQHALAALRQYIGRVDAIVFANYLLSLTSLRYFRRKFKHQTFIGFDFERPLRHRTSLILTTTAVTKTPRFHLATFGRKTISATLDDWPALIDDGELDPTFIRRSVVGYKTFKPTVIYLACTQFTDFVPLLRKIFGPTTKICDGYRNTLTSICHTLRIRGALDGKRKK